MQFVRKFFLIIASSLLGLSLMVTAFWVISASLSNRDATKGWIKDSGAYDNIVEQIINGMTNEQENNPDLKPVQDSIDTVTLSTAAQEAFTPELLQTSFEKIIDGFYNWLEEDNNSLEFSIDLSGAKNTLVDSIISQAENRAKQLPTCTSFDLPENIDLFAIDCIPQGVDVSLLTNDFRQELLSSEDFLPDTVIDAKEIKVDSTDSGGEKSISELSQTDFSEAPRIFGLLRNLTWVVVAVTLILSTLVLFLSSSFRNGAKHLAKSFAIAAFIIVVSALIFRSLPIDFGDGAKNDNSAGDAVGTAIGEAIGDNIAEPIIKQVISTVTTYQFWFSALYGLIALALIGYLLSTRNRTLKTAKSLNPTQNEHQLPTPSEDANTILDSNNVKSDDESAKADEHNSINNS